MSELSVNMSEPLTRFPPTAQQRANSTRQSSFSSVSTTGPRSFPLRSLSAPYPAPTDMTVPAIRIRGDDQETLTYDIHYGVPQTQELARQEGNVYNDEEKSTEGSDELDAAHMASPANLTATITQVVLSSTKQIAYVKTESPIIPRRPSVSDITPSIHASMIDDLSSSSKPLSSLYLIPTSPLSNSSPPSSPSPVASPLTSSPSAPSTPLWSLVAKGWHDMTFASSQLRRVITMSTTTRMFKFQWDDNLYRWEVVRSFSPPNMHTPHQLKYDLQCHLSGTRTVIAEFIDGMTRLVLYPSLIPSTLPSRRSAPSVPTLQTFLILSGLCASDYIHSALASLGGGDDALAILFDPAYSPQGGLDPDFGSPTRFSYAEPEADRYSIAYSDVSSNRLSYSMRSIELRDRWSCCEVGACGLGGCYCYVCDRRCTIL